MVNAKFEVGNKIIKFSRWYTLIRVLINLILGTLFVVLSYALPKESKIIWEYFWIGLSIYAEILLILVFRYFLYGFGMIVCDSAYNLSQKRVTTYLDYREAKKRLSNHQITQKEMEAIEKEYIKNEAGYID